MADMLKTNPEINQKYVDFYREVFKDGVLTLKQKELIAVAELVSTGKVRMMVERVEERGKNSGGCCCE